MKKLPLLLTLAALLFLPMACDDDEDEKTPGDEACESTMTTFYTELEPCLNALGYTIGDPGDAADTFCGSSCDNLDASVAQSDIDACEDAIGDLTCDNLLYDESPGECDWLEDKIECDFS